jgi:hypothetical protein
VPFLHPLDEFTICAHLPHGPSWTLGLSWSLLALAVTTLLGMSRGRACIFYTALHSDNPVKYCGRASSTCAAKQLLKTSHHGKAPETLGKEKRRMTCTNLIGTATFNRVLGVGMGTEGSLFVEMPHIFKQSLA